MLTVYPLINKSELKSFWQCSMSRYRQLILSNYQTSDDLVPHPSQSMQNYRPTELCLLRVYLDPNQKHLRISISLFEIVKKRKNTNEPIATPISAFSRADESWTWLLIIATIWPCSWYPKQTTYLHISLLIIPCKHETQNRCVEMRFHYETRLDAV